jgi:hypothetical protein
MDVQDLKLNGTVVTSTAAELNKLTSVTATTAELNKLAGATATTAEINKLAGLTSTTAELNKLTGVTSTATEINKLTGVTSTTAEINILNGVTSTTAEINRACDVSSRVVNTTANLSLTEASHDNKVVTINQAAGAAITLPAATGSGAKFHLIIGTTVTSNSTTIKVTGNDIMTGAAIICNDADATVSGWETAADSDTITFNGTTTGGIKGDSVELIDIATDTWYVRVMGSATGAEATPFSATVT